MNAERRERLTERRCRLNARIKRMRAERHIIQLKIGECQAALKRIDARLAEPPPAPALPTPPYPFGGQP